MKFWINITTEDGELFERILIQTERTEGELPKGEQARRIADYITRLYDEVPTVQPEDTDWPETIGMPKYHGD